MKKKKEKCQFVTIESSNKDDFDNRINIMINQGWKVTGSNSVPNKY